MNITERIEGEKRVLATLINLATAKGYLLGVWDGFETIRVNTPEEALDHIFGVDESALHCYNPITKKPIGSFYIVLGNSPQECIADHSVNDATHELATQLDLFIEANFAD